MLNEGMKMQCDILFYVIYSRYEYTLASELENLYWQRKSLIDTEMPSGEKLFPQFK